MVGIYGDGLYPTQSSYRGNLPKAVPVPVKNMPVFSQRDDLLNGQTANLCSLDNISPLANFVKQSYNSAL